MLKMAEISATGISPTEEDKGRKKILVSQPHCHHAVYLAVKTQLYVFHILCCFLVRQVQVR